MCLILGVAACQVSNLPVVCHTCHFLKVSTKASSFAFLEGGWVGGQGLMRMRLHGYFPGQVNILMIPTSHPLHDVVFHKLPFSQMKDKQVLLTINGSYLTPPIQYCFPGCWKYFPRQLLTSTAIEKWRCVISCLIRRLPILKGWPLAISTFQLGFYQVVPDRVSLTKALVNENA